MERDLIRMRAERRACALVSHLIASAVMANETTVEVELWLRVLHGILGSLLLLCNLICSCTVILVVSFNKKLHYSSMVMSLGLVVADLILAAIWLIQVIAYSIAGQWQLGKGGCIHFGMILVWMLYVRWCEVAVVTLDRFLIVVFPFYKYKKFHERFLVATTILAWVVPALLVMPSAFGFGEQTFRPQLSACTVYCEDKPSCIGYYALLFIVFKLIGGVLPLSLYTTMYCIGCRKRRQQKNRKLGTISAQGSTTDIPRNVDLRQTTAINNCNHQIMMTANASARVQHVQSANGSKLSIDAQSSWSHLPNPQERNSFITIFIIFVSMILTHIPIYSTSVLEHVGNLYASIPLAVHLSAVYVFLLGMFIDSIVIMRNKDFCEVLVHLVRKCTIRAGHHPRLGMDSSTLSLAESGIHQRGDHANTHEIMLYSNYGEE